jgi:hypothetical protein
MAWLIEGKILSSRQLASQSSIQVDRRSPIHYTSAKSGRLGSIHPAFGASFLEVFQSDPIGFVIDRHLSPGANSINRRV